MTQKDISVDLKFVDKPGSKLRAFANIVLPLGEDGALSLMGFAIIEAGSGETRVAAPSRKSGDRYFDTLTFIGKVAGIVHAAILSEYERAVRSRSDLKGRSDAQ